MEQRLEDESWHVVPTIFLTEWRKFIKNPGQHEKPTSIDLTPLVCEHGRLLASSVRNDFFRAEFTAVYGEDWDVLSVLYLVIGVAISIESRDGKIVTDPGICEECWDKYVRDYTEGRIIVQRVETREACLLPIGIKGESEEIEVEEMNARGGRKRVAGGRRGDRKRGWAAPFDIVCAKTDSVKDIKVKVCVQLCSYL